MKRCPYCAEQIQDEAVKCRFCGEWLPSSPGRSSSGAQRTAISLNYAATLELDSAPSSDGIYLSPAEVAERTIYSLEFPLPNDRYRFPNLPQTPAFGAVITGSSVILLDIDHLLSIDVGTLKDCREPKIIASFERPSSRIFDISFAMGTKAIAFVTDNGIRYLEFENGTSKLLEYPRSVQAEYAGSHWPAVSLSVDGSYIAYCVEGPGSPLKVWDLKSGGTLWTVSKQNQDCDRFAISPNCRLFAAVTYPSEKNPSWLDRSTRLRVLDLFTRQEVFHMEAARGESVSFSKDGSIVAAQRVGRSYNNGRETPPVFALWDAKSGKKIQEIPGYIRVFDFSQDSSYVVGSSAESTTVEVWEVKTGKMVAQDRVLAAEIAVMKEKGRQERRQYDKAHPGGPSYCSPAMYQSSVTASQHPQWDERVRVSSARFSPDGRALMAVIRNSGKEGIRGVRFWNLYGSAQ